MHPYRFASLLLLVLPTMVPAAAATAQQARSEYEGAAALGLDMRRLGTGPRVLMIGAHPDDEDTQLLSALALGRGADVAYLSLTRGEGGQNGIGSELHEALGLLRTEELLAARRVDGAEQFFTRAYDFGYSKTAEETFRHWPREELLSDVVATLRRFRPDIVITVFSGTPRDGHGHHQVSAILAREAFAAAADPARFPQHAALGLRPHQATKLYQTLRTNPAGATLRLPVGELDPLLGRSHFQLAMASRSRHRSQDMGRAEPAGPQWGYLRKILPDSVAEASLFVGVDTSLILRARRAADPGVESLVRQYQAEVLRLRNVLNPLAPDRLVPGLAHAHQLLTRAQASVRAPGADLEMHLRAELEDLQAAAARAAGLVLSADSPDPRVAPGQTVQLTLALWNGGTRSVRVRKLEPRLPAGWSATAADSLRIDDLPPGGLVRRRFEVRVPDKAAPTEAYYLRLPRDGDLYRWEAERAGPSAPASWVPGAPFTGAVLRADAEVEVVGATIPMGADAEFRDVDLRQGELRRPVLVVPRVSVLLDRPARILPAPGGAGPPPPLRVRIQVASEAPDPLGGTLRVVLPPGWSARATTFPMRFDRPGEHREVEVAVHAPAAVDTGSYEISARFEGDDGAQYASGVRFVDYPHVRPRPLLEPASTTARVVDVRVPRDLRVGYITGAGEEGASVLEQLGIRPQVLDADALATGDLARFDVIVAGSRAYEVRPDLASSNPRLMEYVRAGGTLIVLYNKYELVEGRFTPYPLSMGRPHDRVTDETAPIRILEPLHPIFTTPNRITDADFAGWVQERGLYFAREWDPRYTALLETADPDTAPLRGGLLVAQYGKGTYVYTGLAFFRQLPAAVPGAWRLFANLLALGRR